MSADNELTAKLRFLSGVLRTEGAINASDDVLRAAAEIVRLRGEVGTIPQWIYGWMADRGIVPDDDGDGISEGALVEALNNHERELLNAIPKAPAAVPAGEAVAWRFYVEDHPDLKPYWTGWGVDEWFRDQMVKRGCRAEYAHPPAATPPAPVQAAPQEGEASRELAAARAEVTTTALAWGRNLVEGGADGGKASAFDDAVERLERAVLAAHPSACELGADGVGEIIARDKRVWALAGLAEKCGAVKDEGESGLFWTLTLGDFYKLEAALQHRGDSRGGEG